MILMYIFFVLVVVSIGVFIPSICLGTTGKLFIKLFLISLIILIISIITLTVAHNIYKKDIEVVEETYKSNVIMINENKRIELDDVYSIIEKTYKNKSIFIYDYTTYEFFSQNKTIYIDKEGNMSIFNIDNVKGN